MRETTACVSCCLETVSFWTSATAERAAACAALFCSGLPISTELSPIISVQVVKSLVCSGATTTGKVLAKEVGVHRESIRFRGCGEERAGGGDPDARRHVLSRFGVSGGVFTLPGGFQHDAGTGIHGLLLEHFSHGPVGDDRDALSAAAFRGNGRTGCLLGIVEDHEPQAHATEEQDRQPPPATAVRPLRRVRSASRRARRVLWTFMLSPSNPLIRRSHRLLPVPAGCGVVCLTRVTTDHQSVDSSLTRSGSALGYLLTWVPEGYSAGEGGLGRTACRGVNIAALGGARSNEKSYCTWVFDAFI